jgi:hypothetical protein
LSSSKGFSAPILLTGGGPESRCVSRVYGVDGAARAVCTVLLCNNVCTGVPRNIGVTSDVTAARSLLVTFRMLFKATALERGKGLRCEYSSKVPDR